MGAHKVKQRFIAQNADLGGAAVAILTEDSSAIGGTNDGDLPDIGTVGGTYVQAEAVAVRDGVRENAAKINALILALQGSGAIT